jgi:hypothetical protein
MNYLLHLVEIQFLMTLIQNTCVYGQYPIFPTQNLSPYLKFFHLFITRRSLPRFPVTSDPRRHADIEEGEDDRERGEGKEIRFGTGTMWVSSKQRSDGYQGGWWTRFVLWWRRLFC